MSRPSDLVVETVVTVDAELCSALGALVAQLSSSAPPPTTTELEEMVSSPATTLFVARQGTAVAGMLTLALFRVPTGVRALIEDVVVDGTERGAGIGAALVDAALAAATTAGARRVDLTSRPEREAANRLYLRTGFVRRETNVYRHVLDRD